MLVKTAYANACVWLVQINSCIACAYLGLGPLCLLSEASLISVSAVCRYIFI